MQLTGKKREFKFKEYISFSCKCGALWRREVLGNTNQKELRERCNFCGELGWGSLKDVNKEEKENNETSKY